MDNQQNQLSFNNHIKMHMLNNSNSSHLLKRKEDCSTEKMMSMVLRCLSNRKSNPNISNMMSSSKTMSRINNMSNIPKLIRCISSPRLKALKSSCITILLRRSSSHSIQLLLRHRFKSRTLTLKHKTTLKTLSL